MTAVPAGLRPFLDAVGDLLRALGDCKTLPEPVMRALIRVHEEARLLNNPRASAS